MLADAAPMSFLAVGDFSRARAFYEGVLGLEFVSQFELIARAGGGDVATAFVRPAFTRTPDKFRLGQGRDERQREQAAKKGSYAKHGGPL